MNTENETYRVGDRRADGAILAGWAVCEREGGGWTKETGDNGAITRNKADRYLFFSLPHAREDAAIYNGHARVVRVWRKALRSPLVPEPDGGNRLRCALTAAQVELDSARGERDALRRQLANMREKLTELVDRMWEQ